MAEEGSGKGVSFGVIALLMFLGFLAYIGLNIFLALSAGEPITLQSSLIPTFGDVSSSSSASASSTGISRSFGGGPASSSTSATASSVSSKREDDTPWGKIGMALALLLALMGMGGRKLYKKYKEGGGDDERELPIEILEPIVTQKEEIISKISKLEQKKKHVLSQLGRIFAELAAMDQKDHESFIKKRSKKGGEALEQGEKEIDTLILYERDIESLLTKLVHLEKDVQKYLGLFPGSGISQQVQEATNNILKVIADFMEIEEKELHDLQSTQQSFKALSAHARVTKKYAQLIEHGDGEYEELNKQFEDELALFGKLRQLLVEEKSQIIHLITSSKENPADKQDTPYHGEGADRNGSSPQDTDPGEPEKWGAMAEQPYPQSPAGKDKLQRELELARWMQMSAERIKQIRDRLEVLLAQKDKDLKHVLDLMKKLLDLIKTYHNIKDKDVGNKDEVLKQMIETVYHISSLTPHLDKISKLILTFEEIIKVEEKGWQAAINESETILHKQARRTKECNALVENLHQVSIQYGSLRDDIRELLKETKSERHQFDTLHRYLHNKFGEWKHYFTAHEIILGVEDKLVVQLDKLDTAIVDDFIERLYGTVEQMHVHITLEIEIIAKIEKVINAVNLAELHHLIVRRNNTLEDINKKARTLEP